MGYLKWLKELYDWGSFGDALLQGVQMTLGVSVIGSLAAMLGVVIGGASGVQIILAGLFVFIAINVVSIHKVLKRSKPDLEIVYEENNPRFVRPNDQGYVRYYVGLRILCQRSVDAPNVRAQEGPFANQILAVAHGGRPYGNVEIYKGGRLDCDDLEVFELIGLPNYEELGRADEFLTSPHRFTLEARGNNVKVARAEFEYDPAREPMIRMLPR